MVPRGESSGGGEEPVILLFMFLGLVGLVIIDVPIAIALGAVAVVAMVLRSGFEMLPNVGLVLFDGATKFPLIAIPLFILAGAIMNATGISRRLIAFASALLGFVKGGLSMVTIGASLFFAEISGSAVADVAALGSILIPAMERKGYPVAFATAVTSSSATLAVIIPPSIPMILYGVMSGSSVVELFVAGIVPGVVGGVLMMSLAYAMAVRHDYPVEAVFQLRRVWTTFREAAWALLLPLIILGGIFSGWVTATEGAGLAVVTAIVIGGLVYGELDWKHLRVAIVEGGTQTAVVMLLVATSALLGDYLTEAQVPQQVAQSIIAFTDSRVLILALLNVFFLLIGLFLHSAAAIILVVPIVMPLVNAVGIDPVHFGLIVTLNLGIGQQTPPVASVLVTACSVAKADIWAVSKVNAYFVAVLLGVLVLVTYVPVIPMALVEWFYR
jgi:tripartite ATP-independent transporter DctM subunit